MTNPALAYIRLHGRNAETWYRGGGGGTRYDYDYTAAELEEWAGIATDLARQARNVHVLFNNNARGAGTRNAQEFGRLLGIAPRTRRTCHRSSRVSSPRTARRPDGWSVSRESSLRA